MSSSTSSSEAAQRGRAKRVALLLLASFLLLEVVTRQWLVPASRDIGRFQTYPERARALADAAPPRIVLVGNSTTERGVSLGGFRDEWALRTGHAPSVDMLVADASAMSTWYWMVAHLFWKPGLDPDLIVVTYYGGGLTDANALEIGRLARFFTGAGDRRELFEEDLATLGQRADYLLSSVSQTWAARDRIRERTLKLVPGYPAFEIALNEANFRVAGSMAGDVGARATFRALQRFIDRARREGTPVCFVAFPSLPKQPGAAPYVLEPEVLQAIAAAGLCHLDLRHVAGLEPSHYEDAVHLGAAGQRIFTRKLVGALTEAWPPQPR